MANTGETREVRSANIGEIEREIEVAPISVPAPVIAPTPVETPAVEPALEPV